MLVSKWMGDPSKYRMAKTPVHIAHIELTDVELVHFISVSNNRQ